jgi:hypothetical protein
MISVGVGLGHDDLGGPRGPAGEQGECPDRANTGDQHGRSGLHPAAIHRVEGDGGGLDHRRLHVAHRVRHAEDVVAVDHGTLGHAAPVPGQADATHLLAQVIEAAAAVVIVARRDQRLDRDPVARLYVVDRRADVEHFGRELVAEDLRQLGPGVDMRQLGRDDRARDIFVQVGAADAAQHRADQHVGLAQRRLGGGDFFDADVALVVETDGTHSGSPFLKSAVCPICFAAE